MTSTVLSTASQSSVHSGCVFLGDSIADLYAKSGAVVSMVGSAKDLLTFLQSAGTTRHF